MVQEIRVHIYASGLVQGVFFRDNTRQKAQELGVFGWIKNLPDGKVEIIVEGEKKKVKELIEWIKEGPGLVRIDNLDLEEEDYQGEFESFGIKY